MTRVTRGLAVAVIAAAPLALSSCSSSSGSPHGHSSTQGHGSAAGSAGATDACTLVTRAQASAALGTDVPAGTPVNPDPSSPTSACNFQAAGGGINLTIEVGPADIEKRVASAGSGTTPISGLGDEAFTTDSEVFVRRGDTAFLILIVGRTPSDVRSAGVTFARQALANL